MADARDQSDKTHAHALGWDVRATEYPFPSPWLTLRRDQVSAGETDFTYTYMEAAPAVFIVPVTATGDVILIRQYRYAVDEWCLEVPAGGRGEIRDGQSTLRLILCEDLVRKMRYLGKWKWLNL